MSILRASIFTLLEPGRTVPVRALWSEMASDLAAVQPVRYAYEDSWGYRVCLKDEAAVAPDRRIVRYRTVEVAIRRRPGCSTLIDVGIGNLFSAIDAFPPKPEHIVGTPRYAVWARGAGAIALGEHVRLIRQFLADLMDAGWVLQQTTLKARQFEPPIVRNGRGNMPLPTGGFYRLVREPSAMLPRDLEIGVVHQHIDIATRVADQLTRAFASVFGTTAGRLPPIRKFRRPSASAVNLVILDDDADLMVMPNLRAALRDAESAGVRFKLSKLSSLGKPYPARNVAYDMFVIGGGKPWVSADSQRAFCSLDAGHDRERAKSRWVKVEVDEQQTVRSVKVIDTALAEHVPASLVDVMWPESPDAILCRDGRMAQEKQKMEFRARREGRPIVESKKSPKPIIWNESGADLSSAAFGAGIFDEHDDLLLQTAPQNETDYVHPVRLTLGGDDPNELAMAFLSQQAMPGLSLFHMSRLPGALYLADLVSKLTEDGWPKAIGRGFRVPGIIP